jgi:hypothetical protein
MNICKSPTHIFDKKQLLIKTNWNQETKALDQKVHSYKKQNTKMSSLVVINLGLIT